MNKINSWLKKLEELFISKAVVTKGKGKMPSIPWFTSRMAATGGARLDPIQEPATVCHLPLLFPDVFAGSWIRNGAAGT